MELLGPRSSTHVATWGGNPSLYPLHAALSISSGRRRWGARGGTQGSSQPQGMVPVEAQSLASPCAVPLRQMWMWPWPGILTAVSSQELGVLEPFVCHLPCRVPSGQTPWPGPAATEGPGEVDLPSHGPASRGQEAKQGGDGWEACLRRDHLWKALESHGGAWTLIQGAVSRTLCLAYPSVLCPVPVSAFGAAMYSCVLVDSMEPH